MTGPIGELIAEHGAPDAVVHAAGSSSVRVAAEDPAQDFKRTVGGTIELLEALRRWAPEACLLLSSSAAVYGSNHNIPIPEHAAPAPISTYGLHKLRAEELCLEAAERHGLQVAVVRFFSLYGAGLRKQIFWDLWNKIIADDRVVLGGTGSETRDFLHVEDAVRLLLHLAENRGIERPSIVNGGTGIATTIRDAATLLVRSSDCRAEIIFEGLSRPGDPAHLVADIGRLRATGYRSRIELADGLADYAAWAADGASTERASRRAPIATRLGAA